jgi:hypothetical protein
MHMMTMINQLKLTETVDTNATTTTTSMPITSGHLATIKCHQHPSEASTSYCHFCQQSVCGECALSVQHRQHSKSNLVEAVNEVFEF